MENEPKCPSCGGRTTYRNVNCPECWDVIARVGELKRALKEAVAKFSIDDLEILVAQKKDEDQPLVDCYVADYQRYLIEERMK